jgi:hypothetical protein
MSSNKNWVTKMTVDITTGSKPGASHPDSRVWINMGAREFRLKRYGAFLPHQQDKFVIAKEGLKVEPKQLVDIPEDNIIDDPIAVDLDSLLKAPFLIYLGYWSPEVWSVKKITIEIESENGTTKKFGLYNKNKESTANAELVNELEFGVTYGAYVYFMPLD